MDLYVPDNVDASPGIVVAIHYCGGNSGATHSWFESLANDYGFVIISPSVGSGKNCWDAGATRGGEKDAIVQMIDYAVSQTNGDTTRVFAAGASSGACMTNTLVALYPDVFAGGSVLAGVPVGFWTGGNTCGACSQNPPNNSPEQWGDIIRGAYTYTGTRPRVQLWHGTADTTLNYSNLAEEVDQWTNVLGLSDGTSGSGPSGWDRTSYADSSATVMLEVNIGQGKPHDLTSQQLWPDVVRFFGLDQDTPIDSGTGGSANGGSASGGSANGGSANGGSANGGSANGGSANGGSGNGGSGNGGSGNGGSGNGGSGNGSGGATGTSTCISGVATGDRCDPLVDAAECVRSNRTCTCGDVGSWTCINTDGQGGGANAGGATGAGGSLTGTGGATPTGSGGSLSGTGGATPTGAGGATLTGFGGTTTGAGGTAAAGAPANPSGAGGAPTSTPTAAGGDAAISEDRSTGDSGCGCQLPGRTPGGGALSLLLGALAAVVRRRRRSAPMPAPRYS